MADETKTENLKSFNAYVDENGQNMGQDEPTDVARPADLQRRLASEPGGEAETARLASGQGGGRFPPDTWRRSRLSRARLAKAGAAC